MLTRLGLVALALGTGCFAEFGGKVDPEPTTDPTAEQTCTPGALSCECYGNGTCDPDLDCVVEISTCVPAGCEAGSRHCVCDAGGCAAELVCDAGLCVDADGSSSGEDPGTESTAAIETSHGGPSGGSSSGVGDEVGTSTGADGTPTSDAESDSDDETGGPQCGAQSCGMCVSCVAQPEASCGDEAADCVGEVGCQAAAACLASCGVKGLCLDNCCEQLTPGARAAALALNACRADNCAVSCGDYNAGQCG